MAIYECCKTGSKGSIHEIKIFFSRWKAICEFITILNRTSGYRIRMDEWMDVKVLHIFYTMNPTLFHTLMYILVRYIMSQWSISWLILHRPYFLLSDNALIVRKIALRGNGSPNSFYSLTVWKWHISISLFIREYGTLIQCIFNAPRFLIHIIKDPLWENIKSA